MAALAAQGWACPVCTFLNVATDLKCMCCHQGDNPNPPNFMTCPICNQSISLDGADVHVNAHFKNSIDSGVACGQAIAGDRSTGQEADPDILCESAAGTSRHDTAAAGAESKGEAKTLKSSEQVELLKKALTLALSQQPTEQMLKILSRLEEHICAEEMEDALLAAAGSFQWQYKRGFQWHNYGQSENVTIEGERRAGKTTAQFQDKTGNTVTVDIGRGRDSRGMPVRSISKQNDAKETQSTSENFSMFAGKDASTCAACLEAFEAGDSNARQSSCSSRLLLRQPSSSQYVFSNCGHGPLCARCTRFYIDQKVDENDIFPWIVCPAGGCEERLSCEDLLHASSFEKCQQFCKTFLTKHVVRYPEWVPCKFCEFGFLATNDIEGRKMHCEVCGKKQIVQRKKEDLDDSLKEMMKDGSLRPCPKCKFLTFKEYGICNVITCQQCNIVWNWRTRETGRNSKELKQRARRRGTLWEAGELDFQRTLQRTNPKAFKDLLERNGVKYDPNYRRGT